MTNAYWPLPSPDSLGRLVGADDVANAVESTIALWSPFYLAALSGRLIKASQIGGRDQPNAPLAAFGTWVNETDVRSLGTGTPAAYMVRVPGTVGEPMLQGRAYIASWRAQVTIQTFGTTWQMARNFTSWYEKVVRWSVLQHKSLGGFAMSTKWAGATYAGIDHTASRTEGQAVLAFDVQVNDVLDTGRGPAEVPSPLIVPDQDPTATSATATVGMGLEN